MKAKRIQLSSKKRPSPALKHAQMHTLHDAGHVEQDVRETHFASSTHASADAADLAGSFVPWMDSYQSAGSGDVVNGESMPMHQGTREVCYGLTPSPSPGESSIVQMPFVESVIQPCNY